LNLLNPSPPSPGKRKGRELLVTKKIFKMIPLSKDLSRIIWVLLKKIDSSNNNKGLLTDKYFVMDFRSTSTLDSSRGG
jgi:hypothetical protein